MKSIKGGFINIIITLLLLTSCSKNVFFDSHKNIEQNIWYQDSIITFQDSIKTNINPLDISLCIRHTKLFSYKKIPIITDIKTSSWNKRDTIFIDFVDSNLRWKGKGWGSLYSIEKNIGNIYFNNPKVKEPFIIKIIPILNKDIKNINDITLKIYKRN